MKLAPYLREVLEDYRLNAMKTEVMFTFPDYDLDDTGDTVTEHTLPLKIALCEECEGRGTCLTSSLRGIAFSSEDFNDDPDFFYRMQRGAYDCACEDCDGHGRVYVLAEECLTKEQEALVKAVEETAADYARWDYEDSVTRAQESGYYGSY